VDNSKKETDLSRFKDTNKLELLSKKINHGIASALNLALEKALSDGYEWLLTMDQDSSFKPEQLQRLWRDFTSFPKDNVAIYSPLHNAKHVEQNPNTLHDEPLVIMTSGNVVHVDTLVKVGYFDEKLFIDEVDHEICLRLQKNGYKVVQNRSCYLTHSLGTLSTKGVKKYSSKRLYYMLRNYLYIREKYYLSFTDFFKNRDQYLRIFFFKQFFYFDHKFKKVSLLYRAYKDYKDKRMGYEVHFDL